jgi:hypothetical protein
MIFGKVIGRDLLGPWWLPLRGMQAFGVNKDGGIRCHKMM